MPARGRELLSLLKSIQTDIHSLLGKVEEPVKALVEKVNKEVNKALPLAQPVSLNEINAKIDRIIQATPSYTGPTASQLSYAQIAAQNAQLKAQSLAPPIIALPLPGQSPTRPPPPLKHFSAILRVAEQSPLRQSGVSAREILVEVRKEFAGVIATTPLPSGQIRVAFASQMEKEAALAKGTSKDLQGAFQRELFPVEVLAVPTSTQVDCEKGAKNEALISELEQANSRLLKDPKIQKVTWIKGKRSLLPKEENSPPPRSASLVLYFASEDTQKAAALRGVVFHGLLYTARIYDRALQTPRCFKCNRWGHTQAACRAREQCGFCSGEHYSKDCNKQNNTQKCPNCQQKDHAAWEKGKCPVFERFSQRQLALRLQLSQRLAQWESEDRARESLNPAARLFNPALNSHRKRGSALASLDSPAGKRLHAPKRTPGAPTVSEKLQQPEKGQTQLNHQTSSQDPAENLPTQEDTTEATL